MIKPRRENSLELPPCYLQLFLVILRLLPSTDRTRLIAANPLAPSLILPWNEKLSVAQLAAMSLEPYLAYEHFCRPNQFQHKTRFELTCIEVKDNSPAYGQYLSMCLYFLEQSLSKFRRSRSKGQIRSVDMKRLRKAHKSMLTALRYKLGSARTEKVIQGRKEFASYVAKGEFVHFEELMESQFSLMPNRIDSSHPLTDVRGFLNDQIDAEKLNNELPLSSDPVNAYETSSLPSKPHIYASLKSDSDY
ncbi:hypothetical protein Ciccas_004731 [Cichlidogyrus casuarinus]|uniref:Uncharacterized protein n=1 Tax=Cichlidogyrus casuarinus TaxID=1844966 RepID=A0ABD2QAN6_9PLAT